MNAYAWKTAQQTLIRLLRHSTGTALLRAETSLPGCPCLDSWLDSRTAWPHLAWVSRDLPFRSAAAGALYPWQDATIPDAAVARLLDTGPEGARAYIGHPFAPEGGASPEWEAFHAGWTVIPRVELFEREGSWFLAASARADHLDEDIEALLPLLEAPPETMPVPLPDCAPTRRVDYPDLAGWTDAVCTVLHEIAADRLQKAVLARCTRYSFERPLSPIALFGALAANPTPAFRFLYQPNEQVAWVGASPELLYRRDGRTLVSEALAGTRSRHDDPLCDAAAREELLASAKDRHEHALVDTAIRRAFHQIGTTIEPPTPPEVVSPGRCHHLKTRVQGHLKKDLKDGELLRALHPTPAVGGTPVVEAMRHIARLEPFDRGWYTGPVGWWTRDSAETAVGIRSALIHGNTLSVYCGAGIVAGSDPKSEWEELELKLRSFLACAGFRTGVS